MNRKLWKKLILALSAGILISCQTVVTPEYTCPPPLDLPKIKANELACISDDSYKKLDVRDTKLRERIKTYRAMFCKS